MVAALINIVLPVFVVALLGFLYARRQTVTPDMGFINAANVSLFCPALVFSALLTNPVDLSVGWPLLIAGTLIILLPGALLYFVNPQGVSRVAFIVPGMFRNTGNIGIPLMMLAYGKGMLGDIVLLFVLSNLLHFSLGLFLLSQGQSRWLWLKNPNVWAAVLGVLLAPHKTAIPEFVQTSADLVGQIAIPLMLFSLGVRLAHSKISQVGLALRINGFYLLSGAVTATLVVWLLPLSPEWARLIVLSAMLPPAVLNFLLCEQYQVEPDTVANVVLLGNVISIITIPLIIAFTLTYI